MKTRNITIILILIMAIVANAGTSFGLGHSVVTEAQNDAAYGWHGVIHSTFNLVGPVEVGSMVSGTIFTADYAAHDVMVGNIIGTIGLEIEEGFIMEAGTGIQLFNEEAQEDTGWALYYAWDMELISGHHIKPFIIGGLETGKKMTQAGMVLSFEF